MTIVRLLNWCSNKRRECSTNGRRRGSEKRTAQEETSVLQQQNFPEKGILPDGEEGRHKREEATVLHLFNEEEKRWLSALNDCPKERVKRG